MKNIDRFEFIEDNIVKHHMLDTIPNQCPLCHTKISPEAFLVYEMIYHNQYLSIGLKEVVFLCPNNDCKELFIGFYMRGKEDNDYSEYQLYDIKPINYLDNKFEEEVEKISNDFVSIYNQAYKAEQAGLDQICGVGYRKALEFLIKDYLINQNPDKEAIILKTLLMSCIQNWVNDEKVKSAAKRAVWIGNDETHYLRKWNDKDIQDLKKLIKLTVHWISMEILTTNYENDMPDDSSKT